MFQICFREFADIFKVVSKMCNRCSRELPVSVQRIFRNGSVIIRECPGIIRIMFKDVSESFQKCPRGAPYVWQICQKLPESVQRWFRNCSDVSGVQLNCQMCSEVCQQLSRELSETVQKFVRYCADMFHMC